MCGGIWYTFDMRKRNVAYALAAAGAIVAVAFLLRPERGETPNVDVLAPSPVPAAAAANDVRTSLVGTWKSVDDEKYSVTFLEDGAVHEGYASEGTPLADDEGRWIVLVENDALTLVTSYDQEETFVYSIVAFDGTRMTLRERDAIGDIHFIKQTQ